jgi:AcrR family transcriptional regulator
MIRAKAGAKTHAKAPPSDSSAIGRVLTTAERLFAEEGFEVPLSRVERAARVSPAVFRKAAPSKKALLDQVFKRLFAGRWKGEWDALLVDRSQTLEARLSRFYVEYRGNITRTGARLWTRAGLLGLHAKGGFSATLAKRILIPIVHELRHEAGLPPLKRKVTGAELEVATVVHAAIAFPHTRSHLFGMDVHGTLEQLVPMMVRVWLPGAKAELRRLDSKR